MTKTVINFNIGVLYNFPPWLYVLFDCGKQFASSVAKLARLLCSLKYCMDLKVLRVMRQHTNKGLPTYLPTSSPHLYFLLFAHALELTCCFESTRQVSVYTFQAHLTKIFELD